MSKTDVEKSQEDVWVSSACAMCYGFCSIRVHRVNGIVVKIEGNRESPIGNGRLCPKGVAAVMTLYDPNRLNKPLKRTNPEKGMGVDPGWQEISWDEALDLITDKLRKALEEDPRKVFLQATTTLGLSMVNNMFPFVSALGTPNFWVAGGGLHCGNGAHQINGIIRGSWSVVPDYEYCDYAIYFGASKGHAAGHAANANAQKSSDARVRGMKLVVVDPMCNFASGKATEWLPIRPGTDATLALSMVNILVNELGIYDATYLKKHTNAPYLVGTDGYYLRHQKTGRPLVWDATEGRARPFNEPDAENLALDGAFQVDGISVRPSFALLRDHVRKYTPEKASEITTIPANTIRRVAKEFGHAARVGSTITIDGKELPYRPAAAIYFRGSQGHKNCFNNCLSVELLNQIVGCADMPGGALGFNPVCYGHPETGRPRYVPTADEDGLMITGTWVVPHFPYPPAQPVPPQNMGLTDLFTMSMMSPLMASADQEQIWQKVKLPYRPEVMINYGANSVMSVGNAQAVAETLKHIPFIASFDIFLNEFTDFADVVLPDTSYLERNDVTPHYPFIFNLPAGLGEWCWGIRQTAVEPADQRRSFAKVLLELVDRLGLWQPYNVAYNHNLGLQESYKLTPGKKYSYDEICDITLKSFFGDKRGLDWFREHGIIKWPKTVEEVYWRHFLDVRVPIYFEFLKILGEKIKVITDGIGMPVDFRHYEPLPDWLPCPSYQVKEPDFDLYGFYYRDVLHTNSYTMENPWLDEASQMNPYSYNIAINTQTALRKGIKDGDPIWVENIKGRRVKGMACLMEGIHPEGLAIAACAGHWSKDQPIARGKGVFFNELLEVDMEHADPVTLNLDICVKVKVTKAGRD